MEEVRKSIRKNAKILYVICRIAKISSLILGLSALIAGITVKTIDNQSITTLKELFEELSASIGPLSIKDLSEGMTLETKILILGLSVFLGAAVLFIYLHILSGFMKDISKGEQPFTYENAGRLKKIAYVSLLLLLAFPGTGIILMFIGLFLSNLIRYGTYLREKANETEHIQEDMIVSFAEVVENKSEQTGKHVKRVSEYSKILAEEMGLSEEDAERIRLASMMHDIGKLMVPSEILEKPGRLTDEEYAEIKKHSGYGGKLLNSVEGDVMILAKNIALEHHERVDGHGYPDGKQGESIGIEGKIVAVADVYDALTSRRSYKEAWDDRKAYDEIVKGSGTQFDSDVVEVFKRAYPKINRVRQELADAV
ncbi:MAG: HD-GYP domain-containing protein [Lachnospiraceae bacterium]|nr:HD-GYP domain-containing protein [Lachnospiraceae bacterium]